MKLTRGSEHAEAHEAHHQPDRRGLRTRGRVLGQDQPRDRREAGFPKPNFISMMAMGQSKIPLARIPDLARACHVDPVFFLKLALQEHQPELCRTIDETLGEPMTPDEEYLLAIYRLACIDGEVAISPPVAAALMDLFKDFQDDVGKRRGAMARAPADADLNVSGDRQGVEDGRAHEHAYDARLSRMSRIGGIALQRFSRPAATGMRQRLLYALVHAAPALCPAEGDAIAPLAHLSQALTDEPEATHFLVSIERRPLVSLEPEDPGSSEHLELLRVGLAGSPALP